MGKKGGALKANVMRELSKRLRLEGWVVEDRPEQVGLTAMIAQQ
jgi:hypothetical protein